MDVRSVSQSVSQSVNHPFSRLDTINGGLVSLVGGLANHLGGNGIVYGQGVGG